MRPLILGLALAVLALGPLTAQSEPGSDPTTPATRHALALDMGAFWQGLDDVMASPLRYRGRALAPGLAYDGMTADWRWAVRATGAGPRLAPAGPGPGGYEETAWVHGTARLLRPLWRPSGRLVVWAGPGLAVETESRRHVYTEQDWLNYRNSFVALQLAALADLGLGRYGGLTGALAVPVAGIAVRKEYAGVIGRAPRVLASFPPSFLFISHRLTYRLPALAAVRFRVFHEGSIVRHGAPSHLASVSQRLGIAMAWTWGTE